MAARNLQRQATESQIASPVWHARLQLVASAGARYMAITATDLSRSAVHWVASRGLHWTLRGVELEAKEDELSSLATSSCTASTLRASFEAVVLRDLTDGTERGAVGDLESALDAEDMDFLR